MAQQLPSKTPAYVAIAAEIRGWIAGDELQPGDRLPNERDLVERFGVARMTVRHALDIVQLEGLIERRRGRGGGTYVRRLPPPVELSSATSLVAQLERQGWDVDARVLRVEEQEPDAKARAALGLASGEEVTAVTRLGVVAGMPLSVEPVYLPVAIFPRAGELTLTGDMRDVLEDAYGVVAVSKEETLTAALPDDEAQRLLEVPRTLPLTRIERIARDSDERALSYSHGLFRSDVANIRVRTPTPKHLR